MKSKPIGGDVFVIRRQVYSRTDSWPGSQCKSKN